MSAIVTSARASVARTLAETLLAERPDRWWHTMGVARRAAELSVTIPHEDHDVLLVAAWLHDIGYAPTLAETGFHPLDGAAYLDRHGWPPRISALVAHHSGARFLAHAAGLQAALAGYPQEHSVVADALTYADQTAGPAGERLPIRERMAEMLDRHGPTSAQARVHHLRGPYLVAVADRVERRLLTPR